MALAAIEVAGAALTTWPRSGPAVAFGVPVDRKGLSPVMVGRSAPLRRLAGLLPDAGAPHGNGAELALIGGEAGIGKSRLVGELLAGLPAATPRLVGRAGQGAPGRPFSVLLDSVEPVVSAWRSLPPALAPRGDGIRLLLQPVVPALGVPDDRQYGSEELLRAALDLVRHLVPTPGVIVFEDLHGADAESISLFGRLATSPDIDGLVVGTYRPEDVGRSHPFARLMADLERRRSITHVELARLGRGSVGELLSAVYGRPVPWHVADTVLRRSGGNPFFVEELLLAAGQTDPEGLADLPLPWNLSEVVLRHLDELDESQRRVVDAAAVLGSRFPFDVLAGVVASSEDDLIVMLRGLVDAGLLVEEEPDVFSFRHALTREAVAGQLLGRQRRRLHTRALAVMRALGSDDYTALAHHALGAGRYQEVVAFAREGAARFVRMGLTHQALRLAELGLAELGVEPESAGAAELELQTLASQAAWHIGLLDVARRHALEWRRLAAGAGDLASESAALRHLARVEWEAGHWAEQRTYADQALALAEAAVAAPAVGQERVAGEQLALAMALVSEVHMLARQDPFDQREAQAAVRWADRALVLADELGCPMVRPRALVNKGTALVDLPGRLAEGMAVLEQALCEAKAMGDTWNQLRALNNILNPGSWIWPLPRIEAALDEVLEAARRSGREGSAIVLWSAQAVQLGWMKGDLEEARTALAAGRRFVASGVDETERWHLVAWEAELALETGDLQAAGRLLAVQTGDPDGAALGAATGDAELDEYWRVVVQALRARLAALTGDPDLAVKLLLEVTGPHPAGGCQGVRQPFLIAAISVLRSGADPAAAAPGRDPARPGFAGRPRRARCPAPAHGRRPPRGGRAGGRGAGRVRRGPGRSLRLPPGHDGRRRRAGPGPLPAGRRPDRTGPGGRRAGGRPARRLARVAPRPGRRPGQAHPPSGPGPPGRRDRADPEGAGGGGPAGRGPVQRAGGPAAVHLDQDGVGPRVQHPGQARDGVARRGGGVGGPGGRGDRAPESPGPTRRPPPRRPTRRPARYRPSRGSRPTVSPGRSATLLMASSTPGMNELRS